MEEGKLTREMNKGSAKMDERFEALLKAIEIHSKASRSNMKKF